MIIVGIVCALAGFWCGFIFCASLKKKGYEVELESLNSCTITKKQPEEVDESSNKDEVQFLPADIATMYSDMNAAKLLDDCLKDIFHRVNEAAQNGKYKVVIQSSLYKEVNADSFIEALYDMNYRIETGSGRSDYESLITALTNGSTIKILWGEKSLIEEKSLPEEKSLCEEQVNVVQDSCAETGSHSSESDKEINVFHETFEALRQQSS
jgi:hypothetical protein